jgi:8-oxo-dGTP pyrophosphatase MutT (NUDIX family)
MRLLFSMDLKDYDDCNHSFVRNSARSIIVRNGKIALIHSLQYDYYKFPGGGIEDGEDPVAAMIRETREEAGLVVVPASVRPYGYVHRAQRSDRDPTEIFIQDNYYYLCEAKATAVAQKLDGYEAKEGYTLAWVDPLLAIDKNRHVGNCPYNRMMFEREARVLELLVDEGYFK